MFRAVGVIHDFLQRLAVKKGCPRYFLIYYAIFFKVFPEYYYFLINLVTLKSFGIIFTNE